MLQSFKRTWLVLALLLGGAQSILAYALLGPVNEAYQIPAIGYNLPPVAALGNAFPVDVGAPKNFNNGYRWNTPTNYYAFDASFATFFGDKGMAAVDQAFAMFNNLSNVSSYSADLSEWPYVAQRNNFAAQSEFLLDVKSITMQMMLEQLGLASPDRWTWALEDRFLPAGAACPNYEYFVIQRNFDPVTKIYSAYVNNQLLGFTVIDLCGLNPNTFAPLEADAEEYSTDPKYSLTALAAFFELPGQYFTGFTRDDVGGLRALYSATNAYNEIADTNSFQLATNNLLTTLTTSNLAIFEQTALITDPVTLSNLYPGLVIDSFTNFFSNVVTTNFTFFLTNVIGAPAGTVQLAVAETFTTNVQTLFYYTFDNVVILHTYPATQVIQQIEFINGVGARAGTVTTNVVNTVVPLPGVTNGDFYILPSTLCGRYVNPDGSSPPLPDGTPGQLTSVQLATLVQTTNFGTVTFNSFGVVQNNIITISTNYTYLVRQVNCGTNTVAIRQGMEHITFIRRDFDALLGTTWDPITNFYHLTAVTNVPIVQTFRRIVTRPDILFTTTNLLSGPQVVLASSPTSRTTPNFNSTLAIAANQPGPGTISPGVTFTFNDVGPFYRNNGNVYFRNLGGNIGLDGVPDTNFVFRFQFGSFDGTTNLPVLYPDSSSLADLEAQLYYQILTPSPLPTGKVGSVYNLNGVGVGTNGVQFQATGASPFLPPQAPYQWTPNPAGLPPGLTLSSVGILSGTPTQAGTNEFTVQISDAGQRTASKVFILVVTP